jgi:hypothetical protein
MSIDPRFSDLIQADIDGEIDAGEKAVLDAFLAGSEEGRALHRQLAGLVAAIEGLEELQAPPQLRHVVMNMVPAGRSARRATSRFSRLFAAPAFGYIGTFAAGVILALAVVDSGQMSSGAFDDMTGLVGTVADVETIGPTHGSAVIDNSQIAGTVTLRSNGPILILDFDLAATQPVQIVATYSDKTIWFNGFAQLESSGTSIAADAGTVRLEMVGKRRYAVFLNNPGMRPATINMQFLAGGQVLQEANLNFGG